MSETPARISREDVVLEIKKAIVYVKDLDDDPASLPEDMPVFQSDDESAITLDLDSLDALELGILFEERYGLGIGSELELTERTTLADLADFVSDYLARTGATPIEAL